MDKMKKFIECYVPISACKIKEAFSQDRLGGS